MNCKNTFFILSTIMLLASCGGSTPTGDKKVTSITLSDTSITANYGDSVKNITATILPDDATNKTITWSSSNNNVATVNEGAITFLDLGTTSIVATANDGSGISGTCAVTVKESDGYKIKVNIPEHVSVSYYKTQQYDKETPTTITDGGYVYSTDSDKGYKIINGDGQVNLLITVDDGYTYTLSESDTTAFKNRKLPDETGKDNTYRWTKITKDFEINIAVNEITTPVSSITLDTTSIEITTLNKAQGSNKITPTVLPSDATDNTVSWSSDNEQVATVSSKGKVTYVGAGNANITCTANDGSGVNATCSVSVSEDAVKLPVNITVSSEHVHVTYYECYGDIIGASHAIVDSETVFAKDGDEGFNCVNEGQVNLMITVDNGYTLNISPTSAEDGEFKNFKDPSATGVDNLYRWTKITKTFDITIGVNK